MNNLVSEIKKLVELNKDKYEELADFLWNNPEIGLLEYKSSDKIKSILSIN